MASEKRLIDANALEQTFCNGLERVLKSVASSRAKEVAETTLGWCLKKISNAPTVDAVEVVRCKDCKHYFHYGEGVYGCRTFGMMKTQLDGFCSYGERKDNE